MSFRESSTFLNLSLEVTKPRITRLGFYSSPLREAPQKAFLAAAVTIALRGHETVEGELKAVSWPELYTEKKPMKVCAAGE